VDAWFERECALDGHEQEIDFQAAYIRDLMSFTDYPEFHVERQGELFKRWHEDKQADIMGYRNRCYRSTLTGTLAPALHEPWLEVLDDSIEYFLSHNPPRPDDRSQAGTPGPDSPSPAGSPARGTQQDGRVLPRDSGRLRTSAHQFPAARTRDTVGNSPTP